MYFGVKRAVQLIGARAEPTALLITGVGDVFAPGGELRGKVEDPNPLLEHLGTEEVLPFEALRNSAAPVVAAVNGICQGGGLLIAMLSDVAVASERGFAGSVARTSSRTRCGRSARTTEPSNRPAWHAPLRNSSVSRLPHGLRVRSGNTTRIPSVASTPSRAACRDARCSGSRCAFAIASARKP